MPNPFDSLTTASMSTAEAAPAAEAPVKRKPGRPRKVVPPPAAAPPPARAAPPPMTEDDANERAMAAMAIDNIRKTFPKTLGHRKPLPASASLVELRAEFKACSAVLNQQRGLRNAKQLLTAVSKGVEGVVGLVKPEIEGFTDMELPPLMEEPAFTEDLEQFVLTYPALFAVPVEARIGLALLERMTLHIRNPRQPMPAPPASNPAPTA